MTTADESSPVAAAETEQAALYGNVPLGSGVNTFIYPPTSTGRRCLAIDDREESGFATAFESVHVTSSSSYTEVIRAKADVAIPLTQLDAAIEANMSSVSAGQSNRSIFTHVGRIDLMKRFADPIRPEMESGGNQEGNWCADNLEEPAEDLDQFIDECGTHYVAEETWGGLILLSLDMSGATRNEINDLSAGLKVNVQNGATLDIGGAMAEIANSSQSNVSFTATVVGIDVPESLNDGALQPGDWAQFVNEVNGRCQDAIANEDPNLSGKCGQRIEQELRRYQRSHWEACGAFEGIRQIDCYFEAAGVQHEAARADSKVRGFRLLTQGVLDSLARFRFDDVSQAAGVAAYQEYVDKIDWCFDSVPDGSNGGNWSSVIGTCDDAARGEDWNNLCAACNPSPECTASNLRVDYHQLPDVTLIPPVEETFDPYEPNFVESAIETPVISEGGSREYADSAVCVWAGASGAFSGTAEESYLEVLTNGNWRFKSESHQGSLDTYGACVPKFFFSDTTGSAPTWITPETQTVQGSNTQTLTYNHSRSDPERFVNAVGGIGGKFDGTGERVNVLQAYDTGTGGHIPAVLETRTLTGGSLVGYSNWFGLENPLNDQAQWVTSGGSTTWSVGPSMHREHRQKEQMLVPVDEGICFITDVKGEFDGEAEAAYIARVGNFWVLGVRAGCAVANLGVCVAAKNVYAEAKCYAYDQSL